MIEGNKWRSGNGRPQSAAIGLWFLPVFASGQRTSVSMNSVSGFAFAVSSLRQR
jgi:hypothetical protein